MTAVFDPETVYQYDADGLYVGQTAAYNGALPHNTTRAAPPLIPSGWSARWTSAGWILSPPTESPASASANDDEDAQSAAPQVADVRREAARRISESGHDTLILREISTGGAEPCPKVLRDFAAAVRAASNRLETLDPIPADFTDNRHWPVSVEDY